MFKKIIIYLIITISLIFGCNHNIIPDYTITNMELLTSQGKTMDYNSNTDKIVFGRLLDIENYYDVYIMDSNGLNEECITCNIDEIRKHNGTPVFYNNTNYIVFTNEMNETPDEHDEWAIPGKGLSNDLFAINIETKFLQKLTEHEITYPLFGVIHPQVSNNTNKILYATRDSDGIHFNSIWSLRMADIIKDEFDNIWLDNEEVLNPVINDCFYESHDFSADDKYVLFSGNLDVGQSCVTMDIFVLNLETRTLAKLTTDQDIWDEHAHYSPNMQKIIWISSSGFDIEWENPPDTNWENHLITELWIMDSDGNDKTRLTYFNDPEHVHYIENSERVIVADNVWLDDKTIVMCVAVDLKDQENLISMLIKATLK